MNEQPLTEKKTKKKTSRLPTRKANASAYLYKCARILDASGNRLKHKKSLLIPRTNMPPTKHAKWSILWITCVFIEVWYEDTYTEV
jgi:hypothetical protein